MYVHILIKAHLHFLTLFSIQIKSRKAPDTLTNRKILQSPQAKLLAINSCSNFKMKR